ncbi:MAG: hypothetical protein AAFZ07_15570 [Actinomycetota bacterium]
MRRSSQRVVVLGLVLGGCGSDDVDIGDAERFRQDVHLGDPVDGPAP